MGFFKDTMRAYKKISKTIDSLASQSTAKVSTQSNKHNGTVIGDWELYRDSDGLTHRYITNGIKPLDVEERAHGAMPGTYALLLGYYTSDRDDAQYRYVIARGSNDGLDAWFKVGEDFCPEFMTVGEDGTALFFDSDKEKLHIIEPDGAHKSKQLNNYDDFAGNQYGFFWWATNDDRSIQVKAYIPGLDKVINKKAKPKAKEFDFDNALLKDDGLHLYFIVYGDKTDDDRNVELICDLQGNVVEQEPDAK